MTTSFKIKKQSPKLAALYCRVSTIEQGKADFSSLNAQESMLREKCAKEGWKVFKVYVDTKSGATLDRPEMEKMLRDAEERKFDVVVATKLDRLSRSVKDFLELDEQLSRSNIDVAITTQHIDTTTPAGQMQRTIMMAFAQFEREMIAERTRESAYARAQKGFWLGGFVPLGYDIIDKKLVVNKSEASLVKKIYEWYLETPSTRALTRKLNKEGHRTKIRITRSGKKTGGVEFDYQLVHNILRNKIYIGQIKVNGKSFDGLHDGIISSQLFEQVQKQLDLSAIETFTTFEGSPLLLLGTTKCGFCGGNLTTYFASNGKNPTKHYYYKCTTIVKRGSHKCPSRLVPARDLEIFTEKLMLYTAQKEGFFDALTAQLKDNSESELDQMREDLNRLNGNLYSIEKKIDILMGNISDEILKENAKKRIVSMLEDYESQKLDVDRSITDLNTKIKDIEGRKFQKHSLNQVLKEFDLVYQSAPIDTRKQMLKTFLRELIVSAKRGEKNGLLEFKIRGNGSIVKKWTEVVNYKGVSSTPSVVSLRG